MKRDLTLMGLIILLIIVIVGFIIFSPKKIKEEKINEETIELISNLEKNRGLIIDPSKINVKSSRGFGVNFVDISMKDPYTNKRNEYRIVGELPNFNNEYVYDMFLNDFSYYPYLKNKDLMENKKEKDSKIEKILSKYNDKYEIFYIIKYIYIFKNQKMTRQGVIIDFKNDVYYETNDVINLLVNLLNENTKGKIKIEDINWEEMVKPIIHSAILVEVKSLDGNEVDREIYKEIQKDLKEYYANSYIIFSKKEWWELK
ncbi:hypothetical protein [Oceanivirga salmonicida]|uniref:hypothetical protein n=1 Tax=Oceanivirga salmonicida TaxID=1769291 RepID=UPI0012E36859|nr:hypothetical protein [Oceanivirga salmonicida]